MLGAHAKRMSFASPAMAQDPLGLQDGLRKVIDMGDAETMSKALAYDLVKKAYKLD